MAVLDPLVAGNWKMNGLRASLGEVTAVRDAVKAGTSGRATVVVCPPFTLVAASSELCAGSPLKIGGQDCHAAASGASTGDVSAEMLRDAGATFVIVGHSERRAVHNESDALVRAKAEAAARAGLVAIICVGETRSERDEGATLRVVGRQLDGSVPASFRAANTVIAYEPVWAIGTGFVPSAADIEEVHAFLRRRMGNMPGSEGGGVRLLYGGSVKPSNAADLGRIPNVDGFLVGGASLKASEFLGIAGAFG